MSQKKQRYVFSIIFFTLIFISILNPKVSLSEDPEKEYEYAKKKFYSLKASDSKMERRECWTDVIDSFLSVHLNFPESSRGDDSLYMVGVLYEGLYKKSWNKKDLYLAIDSYKMLAKNYPKSSLADDVLYKIACIYKENLDDPASAYCYFMKVVDEYPKGDMKTVAKSALDNLSEYSHKTDCDKVGEKGRGSDAARGKDDDLKSEGIVLLSSIRHFSGDRHTRVVLDLGKEVKYKFGHLGEDSDSNLPFRIYIDIKDALLGEGVGDDLVIGDGLVEKVRTGTTSGGDSNSLRVVLETEGDVNFKVFSLIDPDRIVVDVYKKGIEGEIKAGGGETKESSKPVEINGVPKEIKVVVIDPGHGGRDPGAVGPTGYYEKTANLKISKYLKSYLESKLGLTVKMTRETDKYLTLRERTAIANKYKADLFISVHNNANRSRSPYGVSTYFLAFTSDKKALTVAARENDTTIEKLSELEYILTDLMVSAKSNESSLLAKFVQGEMVDTLESKYDTIKDIGVCQGPFWVLVGAQMPSILLECSFISNRMEEERLKKEEYLKTVALGICNGVEKYIEEMNTAKRKK